MTRLSDLLKDAYDEAKELATECGQTDLSPEEMQEEAERAASEALLAYLKLGRRERRAAGPEIVRKLAREAIIKRLLERWEVMVVRRMSRVRRLVERVAGEEIGSARAVTLLEEALADLDPHLATALLLKCGLGLSWLDLGVAMNLSEDETKVLVRRGLTELRDSLASRRNVS